MTDAVDSQTARVLGSAPRWSGVAATLRNAFIGVSLFSFLAAVVGIASYQIIEQAQDELLDRSLPASLGAERMAKQGLSVVAATPALLAALDDTELEREIARIQATKEEFEEVIPQMRRLDVVDQPLSGIEKDLDTVFANLERQIELVHERNDLEAQIQAAAEQAFTNANRLIEVLKPSIIESSAALLAKSDDIREALAQPNAIGPTTLDAYDELVDVNLFEVERLGEMRFRAENTIDLVQRLLLTSDPNSVASIRNKLSIDLRSLARSALEIDDHSLRQEIARPLQGLSKAAHGERNLFQLQSELISIHEELDWLSKVNRTRAAQLQSSVDRLLGDVESLRRESIEWAREVVTLGRITLVTIALLAFIVAIYVTWRYVFQNVAYRVRRLAQITRDLAQGNLDVPVNVMGNDELGDMADAVRVFKSNATELRRSNKELEQFAYVASHDLKAPLRGISNLATWVEQDLEDTMTDETRQHMRLLKGRIDRMEALLEDLLEYSRAGRRSTEVKSIDLDRAVPEIFKLVVPAERFQLQVTSPLPQFVTAKAPLEQIFRNLISNAAKHHDGARGSVEIAARDLGPLYEFTVRDDGPGIAVQYQEKVFAMFQTLRSRDEIEGSGMGLAIVKKIVESVGCTIVVESDPDRARGTTFRFTWPKRWSGAETTAKAA